MLLKNINYNGGWNWFGLKKKNHRQKKYIAKTKQKHKS